ncbi:radical SAM protein [Accumulibacter sp.]|uniref:B12-binding domain-containing radical SAM protein n=1 Tax=Accumulibacter sp. TaxID=2053492 RepID=UPI0025DCD070|nr:radical SAM protein [Accumulibacter sp.]MCP5227771.1 B12-binding domain-containing radical SAM protein [Accumulibacter sp.]
MPKPRILIVNCYSDNHRQARGNPRVVPQSIAPAVLAGMLDPARVDIRLACEFRDGPFEDLDALRWAELLVLTGLNPAFDRMKQVTAYARAVNPAIVVGMGGPLARMLPNLSQRYFDYVCSGDVEQIVAVVDAVFGCGHAADVPIPRHDLLPASRIIGYAEASRNCNFRCSFCSMTAEDRKFMAYDLNDVRRQIEALGYRQCVMFLDQNFFAGPRAYFTARMALLKELFEQRRFGGWAALVTADFFTNPDNLALARESGCIGFFSGVESFSHAQIQSYAKKQNLVLPQERTIRSCLEAGLVFHYGLIFDLVDQKIDDVLAETEFIVSNPRITLPSFLSFAIPLLGTPLFDRRLREGLLLPNLRLRDMDGRSLVCHPADPLETATAFARLMDSGLLSKRKLAAHAWRFFRHYRSTLTRWGLLSGLANAWAMSYPRLGSNGRDGIRPGRDGCRSYLAGCEPLGSLYRPRIRIPERYRDHFEPLYVTDGDGELHDDLIDDAASLLHPPGSEATGIPTYNAIAMP